MLASSAAACALPCGNGPEDGTALHGSLNTGNVYAPDTIRNNKIITNAQMIGIGAVNILDTYLSPEKYRGTELRYISHTLRERRDSRWSRLIVHQGNMSYSDNRSGKRRRDSRSLHVQLRRTLQLELLRRQPQREGRRTGRCQRWLSLQHTQQQQPCAGTPVAQHIAVGSRHIPLSPVAAQLLAAL